MNRHILLFLAFTCFISIHLFGQGQGTVYAKKKLKPKVEVTYAEKLGTVPPLHELIPVRSTSTLKRNLAKKNRKGPKDFVGRGRNKVVKPELEHQGLDAIRQKSFKGNFSTTVEPSVNINGLTSGSAPNDPTGDVGLNHYLQAINATTLGVFDKTGELLNTFAANTLWSTLGFFSAGDPIVLYDQQANRWLITEFPNENQLLIAVSEDADPMGSYDVYSFATPQFPDYPKYGIWDDLLTVSTNEGSPGTHSIYIFDKIALMAGASSVSMQRLELPGNTNTEAGFFVTTPLDWTGRNEPVGGPMFITLNDSSWGVSDEDQVEIYTINVDFEESDNTTFDNTSIVLSPFDGFPCSATGFGFQCVPQSGGDGLDGIPETIMNQAHYRNFTSHESMIFNFITDVTDGDNLSGIRWVELRRIPGGEWSLHQEGTFAPDDGLDRFMGSICMDGSGNIGLAYNVTSENSFVGVRFTGRRASDPLGEMTVNEFIVAEGTNSITSGGRFGDYSHMTIDPVDDKTFWFTTEYANSDGGGDVNTRIIAFTIEIDTTDIGVTSLLTPQNASNLTSNENVTIQITNFGLEAQEIFEVGYIFEDQAPVIESLNSTILPSETIEHTFSSTVDMSTIGAYDFKLFTNLSGDETISNDTLRTTVSNLPNRDISITAIEGLGGQNCVDSFPINIVLANNGTDLLTSATIDITLNDVLVESINWTGSLELGESEAVPFDLTGFVDGMNQITVTAAAPNGDTDENSSNNAFSDQFMTILDGVPIILTLNLDEFPEETSWTLVDETGNTIAADGPYPPFPINPTIREEFCLDPDACYTFTIFDLENDGICCGFGEGDYNITNADGDFIFTSNGTFTDSETTEFCADFTLPNKDVSITGIEGLSGQNCATFLPISILLTNSGTDLLTSATIDITLNDVLVGSINWTGSLEIGQSEAVSFDLTDFVSETNQITVTASSPNGDTDEDPSNNAFSTQFMTTQDGLPVTLTLNLDNFPQETSWTLVDETGNTIAADGPYSSSETIQEAFCLVPNTCYTFTILDSEGDGICCGFGQGDYNIKDVAGNVLVTSDGTFGGSETNEFCVSPLFNKDIRIAGIEGLSGQTCGSVIPISILLANNGTDLLNSATIDIALNDVLLTSINWTGSLAIGESEAIPLDLTGFVDGTNQITLTAAAPNGDIDENPSNNAFSTEFMSNLGGGLVTLTLNLDNFPGETSWILADAAGNTIAADGPYSSSTTIQEKFCLAPNTCYTFTILDSEGDGICCGFGEGDYNITDAAGNILVASDGTFGSSETNEFCVSTIFNRDISIDAVEGLGSSESCNSSSSSVRPISILLTNNGSDLLTSATVDITLNDVLLASINWTGSLAMGESEAIPFDLTGFMDGSNQITITASSPNGDTDEDPSNNTFSNTVTLNGVLVTLNLNLDNFPEETSWTLVDEAGNTIAADGPYPDTETSVQEAFCLAPDACYTFTILDSEGDGICCDFGIGDYSITDIAGNVLVASDGVFGSVETNEFCVSPLFNNDIRVDVTDAPSGQSCIISSATSIILGNNGTDLLTSATIDITLNDVLLESINWTGSLALGESETIPFDLTGFTEGANQFTVTVSSPNGETDENPSNNTFSTEFVATFGGVPILLTLNLDRFPGETTWILADEAGNTIAADGPYSSSTTIREEFCLAPNACYTFTILDSQSDGICCGFGDGDYNITDPTGNVLVASNGSFGSSETNEFCIDCAITADIDITAVSSADAQDGSILIVSENGSSPFQYSIDNGQTFQANPFFDNLSMGTYSIVIIDNMGCTFEDVVVLDIVSSTTEIGAAQFFKAYPNPTDGIFNLEVSGLEQSSVFLDIEVYNTSGQRVQTSKLGKYGAVFKGQVSLYHYPSGTYLIRFVNNDVSKMIRVIRL